MKRERKFRQGMSKESWEELIARVTNPDPAMKNFTLYAQIQKPVLPEHALIRMEINECLSVMPRWPHLQRHFISGLVEALKEAERKEKL